MGPSKETGMYFEDLSVGEVFESGWHKVTPEEIAMFADLTGDHNPVHTDESYARNTPFGGRIAHGLLTLSLGLGLWSKEGLTKESLVALVSLEDVHFLLPVFPGESLRLRSTVVEKRALRSRPDSGIAKYEENIVNNSQKIVVEFRRTVLLKRRGALPPTASGEKGE